MSEAVVEYVDGHSVHYEDVLPDHSNRVLLISRNGEVVGFTPYEAVLVVVWKKKEQEENEQE
jgi:cytochrome oxidase Cu insertion factor (SCO1/SenC/PrrC family)